MYFSLKLGTDSGLIKISRTLFQIPTFKKHPEEGGEMEIAESYVAVAPDLDNLLGLLCELFYPQYEGLNKVNEIR